MITNDARRTREIKSRTVMVKAAFNKMKALFTSKLDWYSRKKLAKCYIWSVALCGAETWNLRKVDQSYLESYGMWCWRRMEKISWTRREKNLKRILRRVKEDMNILRTIKRGKFNCIGYAAWELPSKTHYWRKDRNKDVMARRGKRSKQLLDYLKERRGCWKL
jgi:hypothetical protein